MEQSISSDSLRLYLHIKAMVITCSSCGRKQAKACGFTFFSYPKDPFLRSEWLKSCGLDIHPENNTSNMKLCSEHFEESNFRHIKSVPLILKPNAIPTLFGKNRSRSAKSVSKTEIQQVLPVNQPVKRKLSLVKEEKKSISAPSLKINPTANRYVPSVAEDNTAGSSAVTNCRQEGVEKCATTVTPTKKRQIWGPRHGMDMLPSHFDTPIKAERNLVIVKQDIKNRDLRIKQLTQQNFRMRRKIECLEHIIEHLESTPSHNGELS